MTHDDDFIGQLENYLDDLEGVTPLPDVVRRALRLELPTVKQISPRTGFMRAVTMLTPVRFAAATIAIAIVAFVGINLLRPPGFTGGPSGSASPLPSPMPSVTSPSSAAPMDEEDPFLIDFSIGRHSLTVDGVSFSFAVDKHGWAPYGTLLMSKSVIRGQAAEAVIYWTTYPDGVDAKPCADLANQPAAASAADLADAVATARGTDLYTSPVDVTVGGQPAKYVAVTVREDLGCDPGFFYSWKAQTGGPLWTATEVGDTIKVWVVDVSGRRLFIVAETAADLSFTRQLTSLERAQVEEEMRKIVESIRFD